MTTPATTTQARFRCSGQDLTLDFDLSTMMGDALEELEEHLGGESVYSWLSRMTGAFRTSVRIRDMRTRDIIALVFLAKAQAEPGVTWRDVATTYAPYTFEMAPPAPPAPPVAPPAAAAVSAPQLHPFPPAPDPQPVAVNPLGIPQPETTQP